MFDSISLQPAFDFITAFDTDVFHWTANIISKREKKWRERIALIFFFF